MLGGPFGTEAVAIKDSLIVMAFEATNRVYFLQSGRLLDRFVPIARRRGAREDLMRQAPTAPAAAQAALYKSSVPVAIGLLTDGTIALVHADVDLAGTVFKGRHFLTLMRPGRYQVCLDIPLSVPDDPMPRFTFAGDTLIAGVMHVTEATQASAFLKRFLVDADRCEWFGVSGSR